MRTSNRWEMLFSHSYLEFKRLRIQQVSHAESLPVVFINHDLQHVNKHTNKSLEGKKTQCSLTILSHAQCPHLGAHNQQTNAARLQHQQERDRIQQEHFNREGNIAYFQHVGKNSMALGENV